MKVHALAGTEQYERHIRAVWRHLPPGLKGDFLTGVQAVGIRHPRDDVFMVGGAQDIPRAPQRLVYVEHGAGQAYGGDPRTAGSRGYHGTVHPANVGWYISPRQDVADSWGRPAFAAGCPALDHLVTTGPTGPPTVVVTFHWDARRLCPEAGSAFSYYQPRLGAMVRHLRSQGFDVVGHWHPRSPTMRKFWRELGVDYIPDIDTVLSTCHMMIADNTSVMYEMAALDRPVIALNCPEYRRDVEHGLRFWSHVPGWQIDSPDEFLALDVGAYWREDWSEPARTLAVNYCYALRPGRAGAAASSWLVNQLESD